MSNNPLWKRQLQDKFDGQDHHGRKRKGVSHETIAKRASSLFRSLTLLRRLGYQIDWATSRATREKSDGMPARPYLSKRLIATPTEAWA